MIVQQLIYKQQLLKLMSEQRTNVLLNNRRAFTARQSMEALVNFAREQDEKIYTRRKRFAFGKGLAVFTLCAIPVAYLAYSVTSGYWRSIYNSSFLTTPIEAIEGNIREYFVPELYLKEREVRKIELGLKDTEELRTLFKKSA